MLMRLIETMQEQGNVEVCTFRLGDINIRTG